MDQLVQLLSNYSIQVDEDDYSKIYDDFLLQEQYIPLYRSLLWIVVIVSDLLVFIVFVVQSQVWNAIHPIYRKIVFYNIITPGILTNFVALYFQPYFVFPYYIVYSFGPVRGGYQVTHLLSSISISLCAPLVAGIAYALYFHYRAVCNRYCFVVSRRTKTVLSIVTPVYVGLNCVMGMVMFESDQDRVKAPLLKADSRLSLLFDNYYAFVMELHGPSFIQCIVVIKFVAEVGCLTIGFHYTAVRIVFCMYRDRHIVSDRTFRQQIAAIFVMIGYCCIYAILLLGPFLLALILIVFRGVFEDLYKYPLALLIIIPLLLPCICICCMYLLIMKPFREGFIALLKKFCGGGNDVTSSLRAQIVIPLNLTGVQQISDHPDDVHPEC